MAEPMQPTLTATGFVARYGLVKYKPNLGRRYPRDGLCEICDRPPVGKPILLFDHCHRHGWVRGLICNYCNDQLGFFENGRRFHEGFLARLVAYLRGCPDCALQRYRAHVEQQEDHQS